MNCIRRKLRKLAAWYLYSHYEHQPLHSKIMSVLEYMLPPGQRYSLFDVQEDAIAHLIRREIAKAEAAASSPADKLYYDRDRLAEDIHQAELCGDTEFLSDAYVRRDALASVIALHENHAVVDVLDEADNLSRKVGEFHDIDTNITSSDNDVAKAIGRMMDARHRYNKKRKNE